MMSRAAEAKQMNETILRCPSCEGYGWLEDDDGNAQDCDWCGGVGYVYRDAAGPHRRIPDTDYPQVAETLERLETERLRELGYSGGAKKPWEQAVRKDTKLGERKPPEKSQ
jgi:hypothetical protein